ncbi:MAG: hypothetical protein ACK5A3_07040, partial [Planctomyces sp.]
MPLPFAAVVRREQQFPITDDSPLTYAAAGCGSLKIQSETEVTHAIPQVLRTARHPVHHPA